VDKPSADLVVRLLEIAAAPNEELEKIRDYHPLRGVTDLWLFGYKNEDFQLLKPGERSAVFQLQSGSEKFYKGSLSLHFFYLNVSDSEKYPQIARVELPRWVAEDESILDSLHAVLIQQCRDGQPPIPTCIVSTRPPWSNMKRRNRSSRSSSRKIRQPGRRRWRSSEQVPWKALAGGREDSWRDCSKQVVPIRRMNTACSTTVS
jgi:hypothetical protein